MKYFNNQNEARSHAFKIAAIAIREVSKDDRKLLAEIEKEKQRILNQSMGEVWVSAVIQAIDDLKDSKDKQIAGAIVRQFETQGRIGSDEAKLLRRIMVKYRMHSENIEWGIRFMAYSALLRTFQRWSSPLMDRDAYLPGYTQQLNKLTKQQARIESKISVPASAPSSSSNSGQPVLNALYARSILNLRSRRSQRPVRIRHSEQ